MNKKSNHDLQAVYEGIYQKGEAAFFSRFSSGADDSENDNVIIQSINWTGLTVLDVGCGSGHTASRIAEAGARKVIGIDYAQSAIEQAQKLHQASNLEFRVLTAADWNEPVDVIISCGTLEHLEEPQDELKRFINLVGPGGIVLITCPYFINLRGIVWMTLARLFDVPMSLTDRHFISPFDMERWTHGTTHQLLSTVCFDFDRANGRRMLEDMKKRLTNALQDAKLPNSRVNDLMEWLTEVVGYHERVGHPGLGGRNALYRIGPRTLPVDKVTS
jgi:2-polyprenyl-3-methyl-5-hydroxy-6-metoxy-1,4-benzoquinol methylase